MNAAQQEQVLVFWQGQHTKKMDAKAFRGRRRGKAGKREREAHIPRAEHHGVPMAARADHSAKPRPSWRREHKCSKDHHGEAHGRVTVFGSPGTTTAAEPHGLAGDALGASREATRAASTRGSGAPSRGGSDAPHLIADDGRRWPENRQTAQATRASRERGVRVLREIVRKGATESDRAGRFLPGIILLDSLQAVPGKTLLLRILPKRTGTFRLMEARDVPGVKLASETTMGGETTIYAAEEVNTEDKKKKRFMRGLNPQFKVQLRMMRATEFQELVDAAITLEDDFKQLQEEKRKKAKFEPKRFVSNKSNTGLSFKPRYNNNRRNQGFQPGNQINCRICGKPGHLSKDCRKPRIICFGCREEGHMLRDCPKKKNGGGQSGGGGNRSGNSGGNWKNKKPFGKLNCTSLEEVVNSDQALIGKANVVAYALSRKSTGGVEQEISPELKKEISQAQIQLWEKEAHEGLSALQVADELSVNLKNEIIMDQLDDPFIVEEMRRIDEGRPSDFTEESRDHYGSRRAFCVSAVLLPRCCFKPSPADLAASPSPALVDGQELASPPATFSFYFSAASG
ncbi:hypothetical protein QYE76_001063 [Lolium multiflorum]|uniref:CCHC-type domain-containing protein n=1 Tax=Lolium multiflorum TaxID=4521 RepID=A0AAD8VZ00_LOLMU|nr:hypothetical protein QYE76_001063 [Lolium multiflorum]